MADITMNIPTIKSNKVKIGVAKPGVSNQKHPAPVIKNVIIIDPEPKAPEVKEQDQGNPKPVADPKLISQNERFTLDSILKMANNFTSTPMKVLQV